MVDEEMLEGVDSGFEIWVVSQCLEVQLRQMEGITFTRYWLALITINCAYTTKLNKNTKVKWDLQRCVTL